MSKKRRQKKEPTLEELQKLLAEAVGQLGEAFTEGLDGDVSEISSRIRAIEKEINDRYYRRFGTP